MSLGFTNSRQSIAITATNVYSFDVCYFEGNSEQQLEVYHAVKVDDNFEFTLLSPDTDYSIVEVKNIVSETLTAIPNEDPQALDAYRISEGIQRGGEIHLTEALPEGDYIYIVRTTPLTQDTDFDGTKFPADAVEGSFDKIHFIAQELKDIITTYNLDEIVPPLLNDLFDVNTSGVLDGQVITYDSATKTYVPTNKYEGLVELRLDDLIDVDTTGAEDNSLMFYDEYANNYKMAKLQDVVVTTIVGEVRTFNLTETQLNAQQLGWLLCDGRPCIGTPYGELTGETAVPDMRGRFVRGLDTTGTIDPDGALRTLGSSQDDEVGPHIHTSLVASSRNGNPNGAGDSHSGNAYWRYSTTQYDTTVNTGLETRPKNVAFNYFIYVGVQ